MLIAQRAKCRRRRNSNKNKCLAVVACAVPCDKAKEMLERGGNRGRVEGTRAAETAVPSATAQAPRMPNPPNTKHPNPNTPNTRTEQPNEPSLPGHFAHKQTQLSTGRTSLNLNSHSDNGAFHFRVFSYLVSAARS